MKNLMSAGPVSVFCFAPAVSCRIKPDVEFPSVLLAYNVDRRTWYGCRVNEKSDYKKLTDHSNDQRSHVTNGTRRPGSTPISKKKNNIKRTICSGKSWRRNGVIHWIHAEQTLTVTRWHIGRIEWKKSDSSEDYVRETWNRCTTEKTRG